MQHQKGLSDDAFEQRYPDDGSCRKAWFAWRWPEGFKCPRCAVTEYSQIRDRQLLEAAKREAAAVLAGPTEEIPKEEIDRALRHMRAHWQKTYGLVEVG